MQVIHFLNKPLPSNVPSKTSRALLDLDDDNIVPVIRNPQQLDDQDAVFYFPGCGSRNACSVRWDWRPKPCFVCRCYDRVAAGLSVLWLSADFFRFR